MYNSAEDIFLRELLTKILTGVTVTKLVTLTWIAHEFVQPRTKAQGKLLVSHDISMQNFHMKWSLWNIFRMPLGVRWVLVDIE